MSIEPGLDMSVVLGAPYGFEAIRKTVSCIRAQTVRSKIELILVVPPSVIIDLADPFLMKAVDGLGCVRLVRTGDCSGGPARAAGARAARANVVAFAEDHCFPDPGWAEALLGAHELDWAAVGPAIRNANPKTVVSRADFLIGYGPWTAPGRARVMDYLPGHNSSYKRSCLVEYGDALDKLMEAETVLHWDLRHRGYGLYFEPAATAAHVNFGFWWSWIVVQTSHGRLFAGTRARHWSPLRRAAFATASPLIPFVRLYRTVRGALESDATVVFIARALPAIVVGLMVDALGQMAGYACGIGGSRDRAARLEAHRDLHVPDADRVVWAVTNPVTEVM